MTEPSAPPVRMAVETITPEAARLLLEKNVHNRTRRETRVLALAGALRRGEWEINGETIKIARDGSLLDGQHRLAAIVESGVPMTTFVARGLPNVAQETVDTGARRSIGDILKLRGVANANDLASALRYLYTYLTERTMQPPRVPPTPQELIALLDRHPQLPDSIRPAKAANRRLKVAPTVLTTLHYLFAGADEADADAFFEKLTTGADLSPDDPILVLRRTLENARERAHQPLTPVKAAWMVKAWNAWLSGRQVTTLTWRPGGTNPEAFPVISGLDVQDLDPLAR